jgi:hypothetical protein
MNRNDVAMVVLAIVWIGCSFYLWSFKQSQVMLFCQSLGMAAIAYPALYWYVTQNRK